MTEKYPGFYTPSHHTHKALVRNIVTLASNVHVFTGYSSSNFSAIIGNDGYILIDTGDNVQGAEAAFKEIQKMTPLPLKAIIMTHSHPDHRGGGEFFQSKAPSNLPVWGHIDFGSEQAGSIGIEKISMERAKKQFGFDIKDEDYTPNCLLPRIPMATPGKPICPNTFATDSVTTLTIAGITLELHMIPGETADHLAIWLPKEQILFSGDHVYRSFPNLYPIRGCGFRDIARWAKAVRRLMEFNARAIVFGHNEPAIGNEVNPLLANYSEAIQYLYDATLEGMNNGLTPDELAISIKLPAHLRDLPYLGEFYGCVPWAVRAIYSGLLGWFDGNATNLVPLTPIEEAQRMASLSGGTQKLLDAAKKALKEKDYRWAAKLGDYLLQLNEEKEGRIVKADALEALSKEILPISGKNYLFSSAQELRAK